MEWMVIDEVTGKPRRKYSNDTMRKLKNYIDKYNLKSPVEGYNDVLDRESILLGSKRLRLPEELTEDRKWQ